MLKITEGDQKLLAAAEAGDVLDVSQQTEREIRAGTIRSLLCAGHAKSPDARGIRLHGARIIGQLDLTDIRASIPLELNGCTHEEPILLTRAHLPYLDLSGSIFPALEGDELSCEHDVQLCGIRCEHVQITGATISGQLSLNGAQLRATDRPALNAERLTIGNSLFLSHGFTARSSHPRGTLYLLGASVTGPLELGGAQLEATNAPALNADWLTLDGSLFLNWGFTAHSSCERGTLRLQGANISGQLNLNDALVHNGTEVGAELVAIDARVESDLVMPMQSLTSGGSRSVLVNVNGLQYPLVPRGATHQEWLTLLAQHTPAYAAQPYQQLSSVYRCAGHEQEARQILIAQQRDLRRRGDIGGRWRKFLHAASGLFIGYGHRPFRALGYLAGLCAIATLVASAASLLGIAVRPAPAKGPCSPAETFGLAVDTVVPLLKTGGAPRCEIATATPWGQVFYVTGYVLQILGWAFATLFVAGYTGLVRTTS